MFRCPTERDKLTENTLSDRVFARDRVPAMTPFIFLLAAFEIPAVEKVLIECKSAPSRGISASRFKIEHEAFLSQQRSHHSDIPSDKADKGG
jgi:hypothetical protein